MNVIKKDAAIEPLGDADAMPGQFRVILSAPTEDRDGDTLLPDEWKTPLPEHITFDQDHGMSVATTVGSGRPYINDGELVPEAPKGALIVDGTYSSLPRAQEVRTLVNEGHITKTSVAFMSVPGTTKSGGKRQRELLNGAFVAVPSNREASVLASKSADRKAGARNNSDDAKRIQDMHDLAGELGASCAAPAKGFRLKDGGEVEDTDPNVLITAADAAVDEALETLQALDQSTLAPEVVQAIALVQAADAALDELGDLLGLPDPDEESGNTEDDPNDPAAAAKAAAGSGSAEDVAELQMRAARIRLRASLTLNDTITERG